jgi:hypothetical protein
MSYPPERKGLRLSKYGSWASAAACRGATIPDSSDELAGDPDADYERLGVSGLALH